MYGATRPTTYDKLRVRTVHRGRNWRIISPYYLLFFSHQQFFSSLLTVCTSFTVKARNIYMRRSALGSTKRRLCSVSAVTFRNVWFVLYRWVFLIFCCIWRCSMQFTLWMRQEELTDIITPDGLPR